MKKILLFLFVLISSFLSFSFSNYYCDYYSGVESGYSLNNVFVVDELPGFIKSKYKMFFPNVLYIVDWPSGPWTSILYKFNFYTGVSSVGFNLFDVWNDYAFKRSDGSDHNVFILDCSEAFSFILRWFAVESLDFNLSVQYFWGVDPYLLFHLKIIHSNSNTLLYEGENKFYFDFVLEWWVDLNNYALWSWLVYLWNKKYSFSWSVIDWKYYVADFDDGSYLSLDLYSKNFPLSSLNIKYSHSVSNCFDYHKFTFSSAWWEFEWLNFVFSGGNGSCSGGGVSGDGGSGYGGSNAFNLGLSNFDFFTCSFFHSSDDRFSTFNFSLHSLFPNFFDNAISSLVPDFMKDYDFLGFITCPVNWISKAFHDSKDFIPVKNLFNFSSTNPNLYTTVSSDQLNKFYFFVNMLLIWWLFLALFFYLIK